MKREININEYQVVEDLLNGVFEARRHGERWRNLIGDNLILSLVDRITELEEEIKELKE